MVNFIVHNGSQMLPSKSPKGKTKHNSPKPQDACVPTPIRVPYHRQASRSVSPLTASESVFGGMQHGNPARSQSSEPSSSGLGASSPLISIDEKEANVELICDYDKSVTPLYEMLESSEWDKARLRCQMHPEEVQTWIVRRDATAKIRWKLLPLHAAVIFQAPVDVVEYLLKVYPVAASQRDDQGMLPLHLAFRHKQEESLLEILLEQYPQGLSVKDRRDRLPIEHGKETQFSAKMLHNYAKIFSKYQPSHAVHEAKSSHEAQSATLKSMYEERMASLIREHDQTIREMEQKADFDKNVVRAQHDQEMDELRDLLSREVASGQRASQLDIDMQEMRTSLELANKETQALRSVLHDQKVYTEEIKSQLRTVLEDQKMLHTFCAQQQEQLEQAQKLREQLFRTLLQREDGKSLHVLREMTQLSDKLMLQTEQILAQTSGSTRNTSGNVDVHTVNHLENKGKHRLDIFQEAGTAKGWGTNAHDHGDDISAITENSNF